MTRLAAVPRAVPLALVAAMAIIGFAPILVRWAGEAPPLAVVVWRTIFATALLAPVAIARGRDDLRALSRRDWGLALAAGFFLGLHFSAWTASIYYTTVASASVLVTSSPLFIAVLGWLVLRERLAPRTVLAIVAGVIGAVLIGVSGGGAAGDAFPRAGVGNGLALFAALMVAIYLLIGRAIRSRVSLLAYLLPVYAAAAATCLVAALIDGTPLAQPGPILLLCLLLAVGPQLVAHGAFNYAVKYVPAAVVGLASLAEPVVGTLLAFVFFAEAPAPLALVGMGVVIAAIAMIYARVGRRQPGR